MLYYNYQGREYDSILSTAQYQSILSSWYSHRHLLPNFRSQDRLVAAVIRGYHTAVFISTRISRSSVDYQPEATAEG